MKCIQVSNRSKRNQLLTELTALYTVSNARLGSKPEDLTTVNQINLSRSAQNFEYSSSKSSNLRKGSDTITIRAKEVKSRGPNTIKLTPPLPTTLPPCTGLNTLQSSHTIPLSDQLRECLIHSSILANVPKVLPVFDADSALSNRMKALSGDLGKCAPSTPTPNEQLIFRPNQGEILLNTAGNLLNQITPANRETSLWQSGKLSVRSGTSNFTECCPGGPCPYIVTFYDAYTDPANEGSGPYIIVFCPIFRVSCVKYNSLFYEIIVSVTIQFSSCPPFFSASLL